MIDELQIWIQLDGISVLMIGQIDRRSSNSRVSQGILTDDSWIFLSHSFCTRSLMRPNASKAFVRGIVNGV